MTMTTTPARVNPLDLGDFGTKPVEAKAPALKETVAAVAEAHGFPSRAAPKPSKVAVPRKGRRYVTGRNQQVNIKATADTVDQFYKAADARSLPLGEVLRLALDALEREGRRKSASD
jgi:hypothetical protein